MAKLKTPRGKLVRKFGENISGNGKYDTITIDIDSSGGTYTYSSGERVNFDEIQVGQVSLSLRLDPSQFYSEEGSGDYTVVFDFTNDFGSATSSFDGRTYWAWFHICETKSNGKCDGGA